MAFVRTAGTKTHLDLVTADGSGIQALTTGPTDATPAWSPDGQKVVGSGGAVRANLRLGGHALPRA
jgi:Tol biopolymer transport system component